MSWKSEENISNCIATIVWHKNFQINMKQYLILNKSYGTFLKVSEVNWDKVKYVNLIGCINLSQKYVEDLK